MQKQRMSLPRLWSRSRALVTRAIAKRALWLDTLRVWRGRPPFIPQPKGNPRVQFVWVWIYEILSWIHIGAALCMQFLGRWIDVVQSRVRLEYKLFLGFALLAVVSLWVGLLSPYWVQSWLAEVQMPPELLAELTRMGLFADYLRLCIVAREVGALCLVAAVLCFYRRRLSYRLFKVAWAAFATLYCWLFWFSLAVPARLHDFDYEIYGKTERNEQWMAFGGYWFLFSIIPVFVLLALGLRECIEMYGGSKGPDSRWGDRVVESARTGGRDPRYRTSAYWAIVLWLSIFVLPVAIRGCGREEPYGLIKGRGEPAVEMVVKKRKKPKKPKQKLVVNRWSPFILKQPKIDDIEVVEELEEMTSDRWTAKTGKSGKLGAGGKGSGGWPHGMENARVRFIRLEYKGGDWDQDMGKESDYNLLIRFHEITGFKIANETESLAINRLRRFPKDQAPPFVFLTGKGGMSLSSDEVKTLRWYCEEEGGCLFIDNGGGNFHASVTRMLARVFPGNPLRDIANDDPIFKAPFEFPSGAPPLWHHAGSRAMGIRHNNRWVVFYHPGDMNDAWKTGHSGVSKEVAEHAYRLGINVMYYTFCQYHRLHFE